MASKSDISRWLVPQDMRRMSTDIAHVSMCFAQGWCSICPSVESLRWSGLYGLAKILVYRHPPSDFAVSDVFTLLDERTIYI